MYGTQRDAQFMHHDQRGECGPYTAIHAEGPWYCMVPEGVEVPPDSPILQSGGFVGLSAFMRDHGALLHRVGWATDHSLFLGLRPGLYGPVGWVRIEQS